MDKLQVGFIGCGRHATKSLFPSLHYAPVQLVCVCDLDEKLAKRNARWFGAPRFYTDYKKMLGENQLDAVIIVTGPTSHAILAGEIVAAGIPVFIEKPPALYLKDALLLAEISEEHNTPVTVGMMKRWALAYQRVKTKNDKIGSAGLSHLNAAFRVGQKNCTGYTLLVDAGIHLLDLLRFLCGDITSIMGEKWETELGVAYAAVLRFASGAVGNVHISDQGSWTRQNEFVELTNTGHVIRSENLIRVMHIPPEGNTDLWEPGFSIPVDQNNNLYLQGYVPQFQAWAESLLAGEHPSPSIADVCRTMQLINELEPNQEYAKAPQRFDHWMEENRWLKTD